MAPPTQHPYAGYPAPMYPMPGQYPGPMPGQYPAPMPGHYPSAYPGAMPGPYGMGGPSAYPAYPGTPGPYFPPTAPSRYGAGAAAVVGGAAGYAAGQGAPPPTPGMTTPPPTPAQAQAGQYAAQSQSMQSPSMQQTSTPTPYPGPTAPGATLDLDDEDEPSRKGLLLGIGGGLLALLALLGLALWVMNRSKDPGASPKPAASATSAGLVACRTLVANLTADQQVDKIQTKLYSLASGAAISSDATYFEQISEDSQPVLDEYGDPCRAAVDSGEADASYADFATAYADAVKTGMTVGQKAAAAQTVTSAQSTQLNDAAGALNDAFSALPPDASGSPDAGASGAPDSGASAGDGTSAGGDGGVPAEPTGGPEPSWDPSAGDGTGVDGYDGSGGAGGTGDNPYDVPTTQPRSVPTVREPVPAGG